MARISRALRQIKENVAQRILASAVEQICRDVQYPYRKRKGATWLTRGGCGWGTAPG